jgi:hypothetical protein
MGAGGIGDADFERVEMAAHVGSVDMGDRHIQSRTGPADFLRGSHNGFRIT